jgi:hypothetical protein
MYNEEATPSSSHASHAGMIMHASQQQAARVASLLSHNLTAPGLFLGLVQ